ncbi:CDP-alcohol phosphatidyltransferase family protein [Bariatricus massiliensis]|uniref:CDP-alcohol phosphatidyltransferase family protein n=1 Tax=Bariatricus massiliensis TaxID=1745713 RepID=A0ABS8DGE8_9FIRM|nr:CDP-alcohol phosphatidyltransferase family protein [Bariatricus massiliensis]MCB7304391.1 CDP-alcohol phosphatidyltransferase family protein [Bariatricus massiliensis]MCB7375042.1 CDP-alcohol phosphatidyltransferase family protein [Bariatricus massiliensis]MCB7387501.1 CDP-alcohol phosphatidyltransferase family protein [Bariatricus massiliensis]MCB7411663.1 CDP-alcohol phosphatidyltransferase family protein [Bariatricus massiliensis]MCQ5253798.1 CDP-alcohol phosphatidyltransferase family pr
MLGFYDYTVVLTYISLFISVGGMMFTMNGHFKLAVTCLALSGLCDMFDGKIARTKKNRTEDEKRFGIQIDSLCDIVCFGVAPALLCYRLGMRSLIGIFILMIYVLAGLIRLAFFNVMEERRQDETDENRKYYQGLPITSAAIALPIVFMLSPILRRDFLVTLHAVVLTIGILFITNFKLKKPKNATLAVLVTIVAIAVLKLFHVG